MLYRLVHHRLAGPFLDEDVDPLAFQLRGDAHGPDPGCTRVDTQQPAASLAAITAIAAVTAHCNVSVRLGSGLFVAARDTGVVFSPWHPAVMPSGEDAGVAKSVLDRLATKYNATIIQIGLAWQLHRSPLTLPIPGTTSLGHLKENLAAADISLDEEEVAELADLVPEEEREVTV